MYILIKKQECSTERTKTKEENRLENTKRNLKQAALEWDNLDIQDEMKSFMYVDCSLRGDPRKDKLIDELNFKKKYAIKENTKKQVICWYYKQTNKTYHSS